MLYIKIRGDKRKAGKIRRRIRELLKAGYKRSLDTCKMAAGGEKATFDIKLDGKNTRITVHVPCS